MDPVTIKLFLKSGRSSGIRTAEISNWSGSAVAGPKTQFSDLLARPELDGSGVYFLLGNDPDSGEEVAYIGEAETLRTRLPNHKNKEYWVQAVVFTSKDDNLSKAHIRYLEGRLIEIAKEVGRVMLMNVQASGARLSESDSAEMEVFLARVQQLLPILGADFLSPPSTLETTDSGQSRLKIRIKGLDAFGRRTDGGFVVFKGSQAVPDDRPSAGKWSRDLRAKLIEREVLSKQDDHLLFEKNYEFSSPSAAAGIVRGGNSNGLAEWKDEITKQKLRELDALE